MLLKLVTLVLPFKPLCGLNALAHLPATDSPLPLPADDLESSLKREWPAAPWTSPVDPVRPCPYGAPLREGIECTNDDASDELPEPDLARVSALCISTAEGRVGVGGTCVPVPTLRLLLFALSRRSFHELEPGKLGNADLVTGGE
jgi:hypothetical protein